MSVKITMVGTGYVGLVTGACFAELGHDVICVDKDDRKIDSIKAGKMPIYEPGLDRLVERHFKSGRLRFSTDLAASVKDREAVFIAVGTPSEKNSGKADLQYIFSAVREVGAAINGFTVVVTKSTVPVGTNGMIAKMLAETTSSTGKFAVASNPEFLREGAAISDFMEPDRVVVGCDDERAAKVMERIYAPLSARNTPFFVTAIETAEMIKYASNAFLAIKVSFINEIADLCEKVNASVGDVAKGIGLDRRIGGAFLRTGPGWGGSCFPKDTRALQTTGEEAGSPLLIVEAAMKANDMRKVAMADRITRLCGNDIRGKTIAVLGVTFKGQTDDMRESPSLDILPLLTKRGARVRAFDPSNPHEASTLLKGIEMEQDIMEAAANADALVVLTDWMVFKSYDLQAIARTMRRPVLIDLRNLFDRRDALAAGFIEYHGLGISG